MLFFFFGKQNTLGAVTVGAAIAAPPRASGDQQQIKSWPPGEPSRKAVAQRRGRVPSDQPKCTAAGRRRQLGGLRPMRRGGGAKGPEGREGNMSCVRGMKEAGSARSKPMGRRAVRPFCCLEEARGNICGRRASSPSTPAASSSCPPRCPSGRLSLELIALSRSLWCLHLLPPSGSSPPPPSCLCFLPPAPGSLLPSLLFRLPLPRPSLSLSQFGSVQLRALDWQDRLVGATGSPVYSVCPAAEDPQSPLSHFLTIAQSVSVQREDARNA
nr:PREDICTED: uncharacterized protein LOC107076577 isoform X1 [Lepisosteus oculatus]